MQSLYSFIIEPKNGRYDNEVDLDGKKLIINTTLDDHKFVNRIGVVKSIPKKKWDSSLKNVKNRKKIVKN